MGELVLKRLVEGGGVLFDGRCAPLIRGLPYPQVLVQLCLPPNRQSPLRGGACIILSLWVKIPTILFRPECGGLRHSWLPLPWIPCARRRRPGQGPIVPQVSPGGPSPSGQRRCLWPRHVLPVQHAGPARGGGAGHRCTSQVTPPTLSSSSCTSLDVGGEAMSPLLRCPRSALCSPL